MPAHRLREHTAYFYTRTTLCGLGGRNPLGRGLGDLGGEGTVLLTVDEFLTPGDLKFFALLDEREGIYGFVGECEAVDGRAHVRGLCNG